MLPPTLSTPRALNILAWIQRPYPFVSWCQRRLGDVFRVPLPPLGELYVVGHPAGVKEVFALSGDDGHAGQANLVLKPFLGDHSLLLLDGAQHQRHRRLMTPAFHGERMASYGASMQKITDDVIDRMPLGRPFAFHESMQELTMGVILRTVFGVAEGARFAELSALLTEALSILAWPPLLFPGLQVDLGSRSPWGRFLRISSQVDALLQAEIEQARGQTGRDDILAMLLAARDVDGQALSDLALKQELVTLLVAGHETTATALSWALRWVLPQRRLVERLRDEVATLPPERILHDELLDGVVKESLRLTPVVPLVGRVMQRPLSLCGFEVPVGALVAPSIYLIHHRPDLYPEPDRFLPDRYRTFRPAAYEFIPFGGGLRRCIGAAFAVFEMKVVLASVFRRLSLRLAPGYEPRNVRRSITITPSRGLPVVIDARSPRRPTREAA